MNSIRKKLAIMLVMFVVGSSVFAQQFLWSTSKDSIIRQVSIDNLEDEVLKFYDHYQFYFDGAGYSKAGFFKSFESSKSFKNSDQSRWKSLRQKIESIRELTVFAFRHNPGTGSVILVLFVTKDNVNMLCFSNDFDEGAQVILRSERQKFVTWLKTLQD